MCKKNIYKLLFLIFSIIITSRICFSQDNSQYHLGSAKTLTGNIFSLVCFVSDANNQWTIEEKNEKIRDIEITEDWIIRQASRWGVNNITFTRDYLGLQNDINLDNIVYWQGSGNYDNRIATRVLNKAGWSSSLAYYESIQENSNSSYILIFIKGNGTNHSFIYSSESFSREAYYFESAVLYHRFPNGSLVPPALIAHEILHLFGAWDLYETSQQTREVADRVRTLFPNSVMHRSSYNINDLEVDEVTAWLIGWNNNPKDWYESFNHQSY